MFTTAALDIITIVRLLAQLWGRTILLDVDNGRQLHWAENLSGEQINFTVH